jgi:hypothetical protein
MEYIRVQILFSKYQLMGIRRRRILRRLKNTYKLAFVTKCSSKKIVSYKNFRLYTGVPAITFLGAFVTKVSLYFWDLRKILRLLIPIKHTVQYIVKRALHTHSAWPKKSVIEVDWPTKPFCYFPRFYKEYNGSLLAFCCKCEKSQKSTHPSAQQVRAEM